MREMIEAKGLFCSLYTDRGSHYWDRPAAGGKVNRENPTQFGRAMARLGIEMIPAYSPEARGRSERAFRTHQGRLPKERRPPPRSAVARPCAAAPSTRPQPPLALPAKPLYRCPCVARSSCRNRFFPTGFQQRHAARLNSPVHHFRP